jgi:sugar transferase (PEP-CTERM/EpsH1 system associated)
VSVHLPPAGEVVPSPTPGADGRGFARSNQIGATQVTPDEEYGAGRTALRVMHVVFGFHPGGMELGVLKLVNGLDPRRIQSAVCSTQGARELAPMLAPRVAFFELQRRAGNDPRLVWDLCRLFQRERPHIVHTHAWGTLLEGLIAARLARVPIVVHGEHGTLQLHVWQRGCQRYAWSRVDRLLSVSSRLAERMAREVGFPLNRIQTLRNGVDLSRFAGHISQAEARRALNLPAEGAVVGAVGRLVPVKDHLGLLETVALLGRDGLRPLIVIAGDGPLRGDIENRAAALGINHQIRLLGHRQDIDTVLAALDIFVLPSRSEGLSNTILEAMAAGVPVVATRVGGADEMVEDGATGILVPPASPQLLAPALARLLQDSGLRLAMGRAGRARVEREFDLLETVRQYEALYADLALKRGLSVLSRPVLHPVPESPGANE